VYPVRSFYTQRMSVAHYCSSVILLAQCLTGMAERFGDFPHTFPLQTADPNTSETPGGPLQSATSVNTGGPVHSATSVNPGGPIQSATDTERDHTLVSVNTSAMLSTNTIPAGSSTGSASASSVHPFSPMSTAMKSTNNGFSAGTSSTRYHHH
jgi:hypothetical protein